MRKLFALALVVVLAALASSAPAGAAIRSTTTYYDPGRVWLTIGLWGGWAHYGAIWDVQQTRDAGQTWWLVKNIELWGIAAGGKTCENAGYCVGWGYGAKAEFLTAANKVVATVNNPPFLRCYDAAYDASSKAFARCRTSSLQLNLSVTKIRFTWNMSVLRRDGWTFSWPQVTKTVPIS